MMTPIGVELGHAVHINYPGKRERIGDLSFLLIRLGIF